jgi:carboxyl-terminal processing protease
VYKRQEQYATSEKLLKMRIKANLAQDIWGYDEFYEIFNQSNEALTRAVEAIQNGEAKKLGIRY